MAPGRRYSPHFCENVSAECDSKVCSTDEPIDKLNDFRKAISALIRADTVVPVTNNQKGPVGRLLKGLGFISSVANCISHPLLSLGRQTKWLLAIG